MKPDRVSASVEVAVDPQTAFRIFTEEIDAWWQRGPHNFYDGGRAAATRIEPGVGGRYLEVYDDATGDVLEIGRITVWEPGKRLVWRMMLDDTEVDIRFEAVPGGTLVNLEQRLIPEGTKAHFYSGWNNILGWFATGTAPRDGAAKPTDLPRIIPILYYQDVAAAAEWLVRVFGMRPRNISNTADYHELALGDSVVILQRLETPDSGGGAVSHSLYAYVDNLDQHFARAQAGGARIVSEIQRHGDRSYTAADLAGHPWTFAQARPTQRR